MICDHLPCLIPFVGVDDDNRAKKRQYTNNLGGVRRATRWVNLNRYQPCSGFGRMRSLKLLEFKSGGVVVAAFCFFLVHFWHFLFRRTFEGLTDPQRSNKAHLIFFFHNLHSNYFWKLGDFTKCSRLHVHAFAKLKMCFLYAYIDATADTQLPILASRHSTLQLSYHLRIKGHADE